MVYNGLSNLLRPFQKPHSIHEETEAQTGQVTHPMSHSCCHGSQIPVETQAFWFEVQAKNMAKNIKGAGGIDPMQKFLGNSQPAGSWFYSTEDKILSTQEVINESAKRVPVRKKIL